MIAGYIPNVGRCWGTQGQQGWVWWLWLQCCLPVLQGGGERSLLALLFSQLERLEAENAHSETYIQSLFTWWAVQRLLWCTNKSHQRSSTSFFHCYVAQRAAAAQSQPSKWNAFVKDMNALSVHTPWQAHTAGSPWVCVSTLALTDHTERNHGARSPLALGTLTVQPWRAGSIQGYRGRASLFSRLWIYQILPKFLHIPH